VRHVEAVQRQLQFVEVGDREPHVRNPALLGQFARSTDRILRSIDPQYVGRRDQASEATGERSSSTPEVDETQARTEVCHD
jgi:hypothetical protein